MKDVLQSCFTQGASGYIRDINQFLAPWSVGIFECGASVHLWHGTDDNWSPVAMADYLARTVPGGKWSYRAAAERLPLFVPFRRGSEDMPAIVRRMTQALCRGLLCDYGSGSPGSQRW